MTEYDDTALLSAWVRDASQEAFAVLARRYAGLLYHAGLRPTGSPELAQEAAQNALAILARKAARVSARPSLAPWLHRTVCYEAAKLLRAERRHHERMKSLHHRQTEPGDIPDLWANAAPVLDAALDALPEADRIVLLHRFFDGWTFEQMAERLGGQSATWRQRGSRALERLRRVLAAKGVGLSTAVIATGLSSSLTQTAPAAVAATLTTAPLAAAALTWKSLVLHSLQTMSIKQAAITVAVALAAAVPLGLQYNAIATSRDRIAALTMAAEALRTAAAAGANSIVSSNEGTAPGTRTRGGVAGAEGGIDLAEWAELFSKDGPGSASDMAKALNAMRTLAAMDAEALKGLIIEAERMDLPPVKRCRLVLALARELGKNSPSSTLPIYLRLSSQSEGGDHRNLISQAAAALRSWTASDPDAAEAWFAGVNASKTLENRSLFTKPSPNLEDELRNQLVIGLITSRSGKAEKWMQEMTPQDGSVVLNQAGTFAEPATIARLSKQLPADFQTTALGGVVMQMARTDLAAAARFANASDLPARDLSTLLVAAASQMGAPQGPGTTDFGKVAERVSWLRREVPEGHADEAVGAFIGSIARNDLPGALSAWEKETAGQTAPDAVLTGAFARQLATMSPDAWQHGQTLAEAMPPGAERDRALKELDQRRWSRTEPGSVEFESATVEPAPQATPVR